MSLAPPVTTSSRWCLSPFFSPSVVLEETVGLESQPFVSPVDLGFSEFSLPGMMFGNGDGESTIQLLGSGDLATSKVRISMPMTPNGTDSGVINGAEAYAAELPFWVSLSS